MKGRIKSGSDLVRLRVASAAYFAQTRAATQEMFALLEDASGRTLPTKAEDAASMDAIAGGMSGLLDRAKALLDHANRTKPALEGGKIAFASEADGAEYDRLAEAFDKASEEFKAVTDKAQAGG